MKEVEHTLQVASNCFNAGNLPQAESLARNLISKGEYLAQAYNLLGLVARAIGLPKHAAGYFQQALQEDKSLVMARKNLKHVQKESKRSKNGGERRHGAYLLIKAWGYGLWADVDHVLGMLLLAEITGRTPVVHWGKNSLYHNGECRNAFELYFEPVSEVGIEVLGSVGRGVFPPKWNDFNLGLDSVNKWEGDCSRMAGLFFLSRNEGVVVSDFHTFVSDLMPWIDRKSFLGGMDGQEIYRYLFKKYIKIKPDIQKEVQQFWEDNLQGNPVIAVHVRGSDKIMESLELKAINARYHDAIEKMFSNDAMIFLMTDSASILEEYKEKYGGRLRYTDCFRTNNGVGVHNHKHSDRRRVGVEIIKDTYLASMCDAFIGYGGSNVATTIVHLKEWPENNVCLFGDNQLFQPHLFLHNR